MPSWVKMGPSEAAGLLRAGCNDMGGVLMNESISRAAGASHGQELGPQAMDDLIRTAGMLPGGRWRKHRQIAGEAGRRMIFASLCLFCVHTALNRQTR